MDQKNIKFIAAIMAGFVVLVVVVWLSGHSLKQDMALEMSKQISEQNDKISALKTQFSQLETSLRGLKNTKETTVGQHGEQIGKLTQNLSQLESTLLSLKMETGTSISQHNGQLEKLSQQSAQIETTLLSLKEETAASARAQNARMEELGNQTTQLGTSLKGDIAALADEQNNKLKGLEAQLQTLQEETVSSNQQHREQIEKLTHKATQLNTLLKGSIASLVDEQNDRVNGFESQLQTLKEEVATSVKQYHSQIDKLECQIKKLDKTLLSLKEKMAILDDQQHNLKDEFGHISTQ